MALRFARAMWLYGLPILALAAVPREHVSRVAVGLGGIIGGLALTSYLSRRRVAVRFPALAAQFQQSKRQPADRLLALGLLIVASALAWVAIGFCYTEPHYAQFLPLAVLTGIWLSGILAFETARRGFSDRS